MLFVIRIFIVYFGLLSAFRPAPYSLWHISKFVPRKSAINARGGLSGDSFGQSFDEYESLPRWLKERCKELGFHSQTHVQSVSLRPVLEGKDVILQAQTGSGKTLVYALPILSNIITSRASIQAVIVVPTRELGLQVCGVLKQLSRGSPEHISIMPLVDGSRNRRQSLWAVADPPHIIVGNPSSLNKLVEKGRLRLNSVSYVVLDEVDACMTNIDTKNDLHKLLSRRLSNTFRDPNLEEDEQIQPELSNYLRTMEEPQYRNHRQTIMCSATIPQRQHFATMCHKNGWCFTLPDLIHVSAKDLVPRQVVHEYIECPQEQKYACLKYLISKELQKCLESVPIQNNTRPSYFKVLNEKRMNATLSSRKDKASHPRFQAMVFVGEDELVSQDVKSLSLRSSMLSTSSAYNSKSRDLFQAMDYIESLFKEKFNHSSVSMLSDSMSNDLRSASLDMFREGNSSVLVCTSHAARGIDIPSITHVFLMNIPDTVDDYIHHVGRAGRLNREGKAITIIPPGSGFVMERYSNEIGVPINKRVLKLKTKAM